MDEDGYPAEHSLNAVQLFFRHICMVSYAGMPFCV